MKRKMQNQKVESKKKGKQRKVLEGTVLSDKMEKTIVVRVVGQRIHPIYKKRMKVSKKYKVHSDEEVKVGSKVKIEQCRPISKDKKWRLKEIIEKSETN